MARTQRGDGGQVVEVPGVHRARVGDDHGGFPAERVQRRVEPLHVDRLAPPHHPDPAQRPAPQPEDGPSRSTGLFPPPPDPDGAASRARTHVA